MKIETGTRNRNLMHRVWKQDQPNKRRKLREAEKQNIFPLGQNIVVTVKMTRKVIVVPSSCSNISNNDLVSSLSHTISDQNIQVEIKGIDEITDLHGWQ